MRGLIVGLSCLASLLAQDDPWAERQLATIPEGLELSHTSTGPDGREYTNHTSFAFGAGGRFVAYTAFRGGRGVAVVGDQILGDFDFLHQPVMDGAREHHAFRAGQRVSDNKEQWWAIVDGNKGKTYAWIGEVAVGAGGAAAFWEQPGAKVQRDGAYNQSSMVFHFGRRTSKKFDATLGLMPPSFRADGKATATLASRGGQSLPLLADGRRETLARRGFAYAEDVLLSPDGKRMAVSCVEGGIPLPPGVPPPPGATAGKWCISLDGDLFGEGADGAGSPVFSPDSKHMAFKFQSGARMGIAVDGEKLPAAGHSFVGNAVFEPNGEAVVYVACEGGEIDDHARLRPWGERSIRGGVYSLHRRSAKGDAETLVEDAEGLAHVVCDASGRLAYARKDKGQWRLVVGDKQSDAFDEVWSPMFDADGGRVAFGVRQGRELWWRVLVLE